MRELCRSRRRSRELCELLGPLFRLLFFCDLSDGQYLFRSLLAEPFEIDVLDEDRQWRIPGLLPMIGELAEFFGFIPSSRAI